MSAIDPQSSQKFHATKRGFWRRQFVLPATTPQIIFDVVFGMVGPVLCFAFDPVVFRNGAMGRALFQEFQLFAYSFSALEIATLSAWLLFGARLSRGGGFISGVLLSGALFCAATGLILLPFSVFGLMLGIGIFGFTPFVTAIVYLRNGCRATERHHDAAALSQAGALVLGFILSLGAPASLSVTIHKIAAQSVDNIIHGDSQQVSAANHRLRALRFVAGAELDRIVDSYAAETDPSRKQFLGGSYHEITGEDIEARIRSLD